MPRPGLIALMGRAPESGAPGTGTYLGSLYINNGQSSFVFSNCDLGDADPTRSIVIIASTRDLSSAAPVTGVTVAGVSAMQAVNYVGTTDTQSRVSIWYASVPTGANGTIVVSCGSTSRRCLMSWWRVSGGTVSIPDTATSDGATSADLSVAVQAGDFVVAGTMANAYADNFHTYTGLTERHDQAEASAADATAASPGTLTASVTLSHSLGQSNAAAVIRIT